MDGETRTLIRHLHPVKKQKLKEALRSMAADPAIGKALHEELEGFCSYRVGNLRIIYSIHRSKKLIQLVMVGPRETIYQDAEKYLKLKARNGSSS